MALEDSLSPDTAKVSVPLPSLSLVSNRVDNKKTYFGACCRLPGYPYCCHHRAHGLG